MAFVKFHGESVPLEMHKVRIVQKLNLLPVDERLECVTAAGNNTFLLQNADVFLDMLTDSGVNAMSDRQQAAMMVADDAYAGSATYRGSTRRSARSSAPSTSCRSTRAARPRTSSARSSSSPARSCR